MLPRVFLHYVMVGPVLAIRWSFFYRNSFVFFLLHSTKINILVGLHWSADVVCLACECLLKCSIGGNPQLSPIPTNSLLAHLYSVQHLPLTPPPKKFNRIVAGNVININQHIRVRSRWIERRTYTTASRTIGKQFSLLPKFLLGKESLIRVVETSVNHQYVNSNKTPPYSNQPCVFQVSTYLRCTWTYPSGRFDLNTLIPVVSEKFHTKNKNRKKQIRKSCSLG